MTVPNVLATIAVFAALTGSAFAASRALVITTKEVRDNSLTGIDFKNLTLDTTKFSSASRTQLRVKGDSGTDGAPGEPGDTGATGPQGNQGNQGATGDAGVPAPRAFTFQTSGQSTRIGGSKPNPNGLELNTFTCGDADGAGDTLIGCTGATGTPIRFPRWNYWCTYLGNSITKHCTTTNTSVPQLSRSNQTILVTSENASGGLLNMPYAGTIVLNATATFYTQRSGANQRLECVLQIARVENGAMQPAVDVGVPITQYRVIDPADRNKQERLLNISVTGAIAQSPGTYETQLVCRAPDDNGQQADRLEFIEGNMSVLSTRTNGQA